MGRTQVLIFFSGGARRFNERFHFSGGWFSSVSPGEDAGSHPFLQGGRRFSSFAIGRTQVLVLFYREDAGSRPFLQGGSRFSSFSTGRTQVLVLFYREDAGSHPFLRGKTHISESYNSSVLTLSKFILYRLFLFAYIY